MKKKTYYHLVLDQSGSMQDCLTATLSGYNEQLQLLRSLQTRYPDQAIRVGLTLFNSDIQHAFENIDPHQVRDLDTTMYKPDGMTALHDAIGTSVKRLHDQIKGELAEGIATVVIVILTDGHENSSTQYNRRSIQNLIKELEATGKWTFSYLGATLDAVEIAKDLNIKAQNSMSFEKEEMRKAYVRLNSSMDAYMDKRSKGENLSSFLVDEKD